jgi:hypothetical protein
MDERCAVVQRIFVRAAERLGSAARLSDALDITHSDLRVYLAGEAMPPEAVLLRAVDIIIEEMSSIRAQFRPEVWQSLSVSSTPRGR